MNIKPNSICSSELDNNAMKLLVFSILLLMFGTPSTTSGVYVENSAVVSVGDPQLDSLITLLLEPTADRMSAVGSPVEIGNVALHHSLIGSYTIAVNAAERKCRHPLFGGADRDPNEVLVYERKHDLDEVIWKDLRSKYLSDSTYCVLVYARISEHLSTANLILIMSPTMPVRYLSAVAYRCNDDKEYQYSVAVTHE